MEILSKAIFIALFCDVVIGIELTAEFLLTAYFRGAFKALNFEDFKRRVSQKDWRSAKCSLRNCLIIGIVLILLLIVI
jgi:hypothetical protein